MTRLGPFDALSRGIANVRANPGVILIAFSSTVVTTAIVVASAVPWLGLLGLDPGELLGVSGSTTDPGVLFERLRLLFSPGEVATRLLTGLVSVSVGLTVAMLVAAWAWGGILGVLAAGDAQAPPGPGRAPVLFRTWSSRLLVGEGHRLAIRIFLLWCVLQLAVLLLIVLVGVAVAFGVGIGARRGFGAGLAVGCGAVLPLGILMLLVGMGGWLAKLELVDPRHGVFSSLRAGFDLLGRRLGAALVLAILFVALTMALSIALNLSTTLLQLVALSSPAAGAVVTLLNLSLQWLGGAALSVTFSAAGLALVRSERAALAAAPE